MAAAKSNASIRPSKKVTHGVVASLQHIKPWTWLSSACYRPAAGEPRAITGLKRSSTVRCGSIKRTFSSSSKTSGKTLGTCSNPTMHVNWTIVLKLSYLESSARLSKQRQKSEMCLTVRHRQDPSNIAMPCTLIAMPCTCRA